MQCDMCDSGAVVLALIEGAEVNVCNSCAKFGTVIGKAVPPKPKEEEEKTSVSIPARSEIITMISKDYSQKVKQARESMHLKQEELAKQIAEKVSVIHQIETGHFKPSMPLARKLEKFLRINIVEQYEEKSKVQKGESSEGVTIGDMLKAR